MMNGHITMPPIDPEMIYHPTERCPICYEPALLWERCRCAWYCIKCENGHQWHTCTVHKAIVVGVHDHHVVGCTCRIKRLPFIPPKKIKLLIKQEPKKKETMKLTRAFETFMGFLIFIAYIALCALPFAVVSFLTYLVVR